MSTIYISDLDGTLLRSDTTLSAFGRDALNGLLDDGLLFTVASARSVASIRPIFGELRIRLPIVELNGAFVSDYVTGHHRLIHHLDAESVAATCDVLRLEGCLPFISTFDGTADRLYYTDTANPGMEWYVDNRLRDRDKRLQRVPTMAGALSEQVVCVTVIDRLDTVVRVREAITERLGDRAEMHVIENSHSPGWHWLMVQDRKATKDRGVKGLLKATGLLGCEIVVFGDQTNDIRMFQMADRAYATQNAVEELKSVATEVIGPNEQDSVVRFIQSEVADA